MKKIYITGVSGTGKTTIAHELEKRGFYVISIDEVNNLCSWINKETGEKEGGKDADMNVEFVHKHDWICDIEYLNKLINKDTDLVFVTGMATNQDDFLYLFNKIILLECDPDTFCKRIEERTDNNFGKDKKVQEGILNRYKPYAEKMIKKGAISVNTDKSIREVVDDILHKIT